MSNSGFNIYYVNQRFLWCLKRCQSQIVLLVSVLSVGVISVSYTHLDVYKRQVQGLPWLFKTLILYLVSKNTVDWHIWNVPILFTHLLRCSGRGGGGSGLPLDHLYLRNGAACTGFRSLVHLLHLLTLVHWISCTYYIVQCCVNMKFFICFL